MASNKVVQADIVKQIKAEMGAKGWKQADLCLAAGVTTSTLSRYMAGVRDMPLPVVAELAKALDLTFIELLKRAEVRAEEERKDQP